MIVSTSVSVSKSNFCSCQIKAVCERANRLFLVERGKAMEDYRTIRGTSLGEYQEKHSRFIATAAFADTEEKALAVLEEVRAANRTARHNVYAYCLRQDNRVRYSDDGEPAKTAGVPVLEVIRHAGLSDIIIVVTRYFGGILLGTGGLVRAYTAAAKDALDKAAMVTVRSCVTGQITLDYSLYERAVLLIRQSGAQLEDPLFADRVTLAFTLPQGTEPPLVRALEELTRSQGSVRISPPRYLPFEEM